MPELPTGTVTFLFTDIEGSTRLWEQSPTEMKAATGRHDALVEEIVDGNGGVVVRPRGEGDSRFAVFARARDAVAAAAVLQAALHAEGWPTSQPLRVRIALHTGEADLRDGDYYGTAVNRCARLRAIAHGGQILLSQSTFELVRDALPGGVGVRDLDEQRLADLIRPERVFQLLRADLPADFPPLRSLDAYPHNLPVQLTSFIGREQELTELGRALRTTRLLTLTGTGGCGKTRLALQAAADAVAAYPDGVWLAELASLTDPALVLPAVAAAIGVREEPGQPLLTTLLAALRARRLLLVLDNCEHLLDACARLADALLRSCPHVRILATSREALGISGEVARRVPSLAVPSPDQLPPVDRLTEYAAVQLFVERAVAVLPTFAVTNQNAPALAQLCWRLDGIPLALELAAARVRVVTVEQIASRLGDRFRLLTGGSRTALRRQQTLGAAIDWSHDLLTEPERVLFRRLAVFAGGWSLEAAEGVCGEAVEVLDLLTGLVDKSLVVAEGHSGEERYHLLETLRQYAGEKLLAAGEAELVRDRHRDWYLELAERAKPELIGPEQVTWLDRLEQERDNLRAALEWAVERGAADQALRLAAAVWRLWHVRDNPNEGWEWLLRVLAAPGAAGSTRARAEVLEGACELAWRAHGDESVVARLGEERLAIYRSLGDRRGTAWALCHLATHALNTGDTTRAEGLAAEALALTREADAPWVVAQVQEALGRAAAYRGDYPLARRRLEESVAIFRTLGDRRAISNGLQYLRWLTREQGDDVATRTYASEALTLARELRSNYHMASALYGLGQVARLEGDLARSRALFEECLALAREQGNRWMMGLLFLNLGRLAQLDGDVGRAEGLLRQSLAVFRDLGDQAGLSAAVGFLGVLAISRGAPRTAVRLSGAVAPGPALSLPLTPADRRAYEESLAVARTALGEDAFAAARAEGQAMTLEQAVASALNDGDA
jgi:predicted ATPase/class 3 adenylate cyclase